MLDNQPIDRVKTTLPVEIQRVFDRSAIPLNEQLIGPHFRNEEELADVRNAVNSLAPTGHYY